MVSNLSLHVTMVISIPYALKIGIYIKKLEMKYSVDHFKFFASDMMRGVCISVLFHVKALLIAIRSSLVGGHIQRIQIFHSSDGEN